MLASVRLENRRKGNQRCLGEAGSRRVIGLRWQSDRAASGAKDLPRSDALRFESLEARRLLSLAPIISEVDPGNKSGIVDALGNTADWLEIYNPDPTTAVNLSGWSLYYKRPVTQPARRGHSPTTWCLVPGAFRVIFCDSNDTSTARRTRWASWTRASISARTALRSSLSIRPPLHRRLDAHLPDLEFGHLVRPGRDGRGNGPRGGGGHGKLLCPDRQAVGRNGTSPVSTPLVGVGADGPGVGQYRGSRFRHHALPGEHRSHQQRSDGPSGHRHALRTDFGNQRDRGRCWTSWTPARAATSGNGE